MDQVTQAIVFIKEEMGESYYSSRLISILEGRDTYPSSQIRGDRSRVFQRYSINREDLEDALRGFWFWIKHKGKYFQDPLTGTGKHSGQSIDIWLEESLKDWANGTSIANLYLRDLLLGKIGDETDERYQDTT